MSRGDDRSLGRIQPRISVAICGRSPRIAGYAGERRNGRSAVTFNGDFDHLANSVDPVGQASDPFGDYADSGTLDGGVYAVGTARFVPNGSRPRGRGVHVNNAASISAMPTGGGYWVFGPQVAPTPGRGT